MPEVNPPLYMTINDVYQGRDLALPWRDVIGEGALSSTDLAVSQVTPAEMGVNVAVGAAWITGDTSPASQGAYRVRTDAVVKLAIGPNAAGSARPDLVIAEILDADFSGTQRLWRLRVVQGVAGGATPALPANSIPLAVVTVPAGAASIVNANIADARYRASVGGVMLPGKYRGRLTSAQMTALTNVQDGDVVDLIADATLGVIWRFVYNAASASPYKWEFVGGSPLENNVVASWVQNDTAWVNSGTGPQLTTPRAGDYDMIVGCHIFFSGSTIWGAAMSVKMGAGGNEPSLQAHGGGTNPGGVAIGANIINQVRVPGRPANEAWIAVYSNGGGQAMGFERRFLHMRPVRVS